MLIVRGAAFKYTDARTITGLPASFGALSSGAASAAAMAGVFVLSWIVLTRTPFGRHVYAIGGNEDAAWLSGVRVQTGEARGLQPSAARRPRWPACWWRRA